VKVGFEELYKRRHFILPRWIENGSKCLIEPVKKPFQTRPENTLVVWYRTKAYQTKHPATTKTESYEYV
jgi:hypothetical protein